MKPGMYLAMAAIPLNPPFEVKWIRAGEAFEVLDANDGLVLLRFDGIRVWKRASYFDGRCAWSCALPAQDRAVRTVEGGVCLDEERIRLDDFEALAREMGVPLMPGCAHG